MGLKIIFIGIVSFLAFTKAITDDYIENQIGPERKNHLKSEMPVVFKQLQLLKEDCGEVCDTSDRFEKIRVIHFVII